MGKKLLFFTSHAHIHIYIYIHMENYCGNVRIRLVLLIRKISGNNNKMIWLSNHKDDGLKKLKRYTI